MQKLKKKPLDSAEVLQDQIDALIDSVNDANETIETLQSVIEKLATGNTKKKNWLQSFLEPED